MPSSGVGAPERLRVVSMLGLGGHATHTWALLQGEALRSHERGAGVEGALPLLMTATAHRRASWQARRRAMHAVDICSHAV